MRKKIWRRSVTWLALGALTLGLAWMALKIPAERAVKVPDGREIVLQTASFGTEHRFVVGKLWWRIVAPWLPARSLARLGVQVARHRSEAPTLMCWVQVRGGPSRNFPVMEAAVFDEQGNESDVVRYSAAAYPPHGGIVMGWAFANFPRRNGIVGIRIYERDDAYQPRRVAEFTVLNPATGRYPEWTAPALPLALRQGKTEFSLWSLKAGGPTPAWAKVSNGHTGNWAAAAFRITRNGQPMEPWQIDSVELSDATGNVATPPAQFVTNPDGLLLLAYPAAFWSGESAWKMKVEFSRTSSFGPDELWSATSVAVPRAGATTKTMPQVKRQGVTLAAFELNREVPIGPPAFGVPRFNAEATLSALPPTPGVRTMLLSVTDDHGRMIRHQTANRNAMGNWHCRLEIPPEAKALDFSFAVQQTHFLEFLVNPERVAAEKSAVVK